MIKNIFNDDLIKNSRLVLCPTCDVELRVSLEEEEFECDECGKCSGLCPEGSYPEEFVWHPRRKF